MADSAGRSAPLIRATVIGTLLQLAMVVSGHYIIAIKEWFAIGGVGISTVTGLLYALWSRSSSTAEVLKGGGIAGGVSALVGIAVSCLLKDVSAIILALGTLSSAVGGVAGAYVGKFINKSAA